MGTDMTEKSKFSACMPEMPEMPENLIPGGFIFASYEHTSCLAFQILAK